MCSLALNTNIDVSRSFATLLWLLLTVTAVDAGAKNLPVMLRVKPQLCITDKREQDCETSFIVQWESEQAGDFCLKDNLSTVPLYCWVQKTFGSFAEDRIVVRSFSYWLTMPGRDQPLAEAKVELMTIGSSDRRRNRRNRHAWSIL